MMTSLITTVAVILTVVGALNWGLVGGFGINLVTMLLGEGTLLTTVTYVLVGVAGAFTGYTHFFGKK